MEDMETQFWLQQKNISSGCCKLETGQVEIDEWLESRGGGGGSPCVESEERLEQLVGRNELWHFCDSIKWDQRAPILAQPWWWWWCIRSGHWHIFLLFAFCIKKSLIRQEIRSTALHQRGSLSFPFLRASLSFRSLVLWNAFWADTGALQRPSTSPRALPLQLQGYKDTASSAEVPSHCQKPLAQTWIMKS